MKTQDYRKITLLPTLAMLVLTIFCMPSARALESKTFIGIKFILIEPGCFQMGNDKTPTDNTIGEMPSHRVCIEKPFYLGETEVMQKQWENVMGSNPSKVKAEDRPVDRVSWNDAQDFIQKLNAKDGGKHFRLPTEAEWEYAARAGSDSDYSYGNDSKSLAQYAWFGNLGYKGSSHEVAQKQPNDWGLYDMHGNVWEWVQDWYGPTYYSNSPANNPLGPESGKYRVYRGGSWVGKATNLRSAVRFSALPVTRTHDLGFRLVRLLD
ncbi:MAG: formylglycine-generating enzyme family protein [Methyloglobulus sp.]|nr:formylglycine-generating enzyme family protein [Methyloglobulus sp.]